MEDAAAVREMEETVIETDEYAVDMLKEENKLNLQHDEIDSHVEAIDGVQEIAAEMRSLLDNNECLSVESAAFAHHAINTYLSKIGLTSRDAMPSIEAFAGKGAYSATVISLEEVEEKTDNLWQKLLKLLSKALAMARNFFDKIFANIGALEKRVAAIKSKIKSLGDKTTNSKTNVPGATILQYDNKLSIDGMIKGFAEAEIVFRKWVPQYIKDATDTLVETARNLKSMKKEEVKSDKDESNSQDASAATPEPEKVKTPNRKSTTETIIGDKAVRVLQKLTSNVAVDSTDDKDFFNAESKLENVEEYEKYTGNTELRTPKLDSLSKLTEIIEKLIKEIVSLKKELSKDGSLAKTQQDVLNAVKSKMGSSATPWKVGGATAKLAGARKDYSKVLTKLTSHTFNASRLALNYISACLVKYDKSDDK